MKLTEFINTAIVINTSERKNQVVAKMFKVTETGVSGDAMAIWWEEPNYARGLSVHCYTNPIVNQSSRNAIAGLGVPYMTVNIRQCNSANLLSSVQALKAYFFISLNTQLIISRYKLPCN
jgi:hypothetical protein